MFRRVDRSSDRCACRHPALLFLLLSDSRPDTQGSKPNRINSHACSWIFLCMHTPAEEQCQKVDVSFMDPILIYGWILFFWLLTCSAVKGLLWHLTNLCLSQNTDSTTLMNLGYSTNQYSQSDEKITYQFYLCTQGFTYSYTSAFLCIKKMHKFFSVVSLFQV